MERVGRNLALVLALGAAVYLLLAVFSDLRNVGAALEVSNYNLLPVILALVSLSYLGRFFRWAYYLGVLKVSVLTGVIAANFAAGLSMTISPGSSVRSLRACVSKVLGQC